MSLGYSPHNTGTTINPEGIIGSNWTLWHGDNFFAL